MHHKLIFLFIKTILEKQKPTHSGKGGASEGSPRVKVKISENKKHPLIAEKKLF